jgi:transposase
MSMDATLLDNSLTDTSVQPISCLTSADATSASLPNLQPATLPDDPQLLKRMIEELLESLHKTQRQRDAVQHRLHLLLQRLYGPRSEKIDPNQLLLFADVLAKPEPVAESASREDTPALASEVTQTSAKRSGHGRKELPAHLPRVPLVHDLTEAEKLCPDCGQLRHKIGEQKSEQLEYVPASLFVLEHTRYTYACKHCQEQQGQCPVQTAAKPAQPIDKGLPGPGLLAYVITSKYGDHLPLYRLERILSRHGVELSRSTLSAWLGRAAHLLQPVYECMVREVLASHVLHTDDTPVPVLDPEQDKTKTGRLWVYVGDAGHPYNVFAYTPNRKRDGPQEFLKDFRGYLQADAFGGYDGIYATGHVREVCCNAHARRKFFEAKESDALRAARALAYYRDLYALEAQIKSDADDERLRARQEKAVPILAEFRAWLETEQPRVLPKSPMGNAIGYALNQWDALARYAAAGFLAIDNNVAEREMKRIAIGRKNWLFAGSDRGGETAAVLFSLVSSCQRHGIDPQLYLRDVLVRMPTEPVDHVGDLLPDCWQAENQ